MDSVEGAQEKKEDSLNESCPNKLVSTSSGTLWIEAAGPTLVFCFLILRLCFHKQ